MPGIDKNTILMLHMNDNLFKDKCGHEVINNGVALDTNNKVFGSGSGDFRNSKYLQINLNSNELYENNEFTIDAMFYLYSNTQIASIGSSNFSTSKGFFIGIGSSQHWFFQQGTVGINASNVATINQWVHIAIVYKENNISIFQDGKKMISTNITLNNTFDSIYIGFRPDNSWHMNGNIDELRISNIARWTENFTPSNKEYSINSKYLIKQNDKYYSIKPEFYNIETDSYDPQLITDLTADKFITYGIDDISSMHCNALNKLIENKYNIALLK